MSSAKRTSEEEPKEERLVPVQKSGLEKALDFLKKNKIAIGIGGFMLLIFIGLQVVRKQLTTNTGDKTAFQAGKTPNLSKQNQDAQEAQERQTRLDAITQNLADAGTPTPLQAEGKQEKLTSFSSKDAYASNAPTVEEKAAAPLQQVEAPMKVARVYQAERRQTRKRERAEITTENQAGVTQNSTEQNGFNTVVVSKNSNQKVKTHGTGYIKAAVYGHQTIRSGGQVRLRLLEEMKVDETTIPANTICTGIAMLGSNRVSIALTSAQVRGQNISLKKIVFDRDLIPGIAFTNDNAVQQSMRQQRNSGIDQATNDVVSTLPQMGGLAGAAVVTGAGVARGVSNAIRYGGVQKQIGEIELEEGYRVFIRE